jgi:DNA-binding transcriptional MocR family regulator
MPSVREFSRTHGVAVSTGVEAYRILEAEGLLQARPKSGYYVRLRQAASEPIATEPVSIPAHYTRAEVLTAMERNRGLLHAMAFATPNPALLPTRRLANITSRILRDRPDEAMNYSHPAGLRELREHVAQRMVLAGVAVSPDDLVLTNGCQEAMALALRATCEPGSTVLVESPCFYGVLQLMQVLGYRCVPLKTDPHLGLSLEWTEAALKRLRDAGERVRALVVVPNFHNPLGSQMPDTRKAQLVELAARYDLILIEDDAYGELAYSDHRPRLVRAFDSEGAVLSCGSFSKTLAPGFRVGWVAAGRWRMAIEQLKLALSLCNPAMTHLALADYLDAGFYDGLLRKSRRVYRDHAHLMRQHILAHFPAGTRVSTPAGGFVLWVQLPDGFDSVSAYNDAVQAGIGFTPGTLFSTDDTYRNCLRLSAATWNETVAMAVRRLGQLIASQAALRGS